jgi:hypothetical protein
MADITRRSFFSRVVGGAVAAPAFVSAVRADAPLPPFPSLSSSDALLLRPGDAHYTDYQQAFNLRTALKPQLRALCKTSKAVGVMVDWCRSNGLPFAVRCGGHSFEGFSQSTSVVIDMRLLSAINVDAKAAIATVGAGASLGGLYGAIAPHGLAFTGGSCPTVGVSGHLLGGGYGYLARPHGLACDSLLSVDLINPDGPLLNDRPRLCDQLRMRCEVVLCHGDDLTLCDVVKLKPLALQRLLDGLFCLAMCQRCRCSAHACWQWL